MLAAPATGVAQLSQPDLVARGRLEYHPAYGRSRSSTIGMPNQMHSWVKIMIWRRGAPMVIGRRSALQHHGTPTGTRAAFGGMLESFLAGPGVAKRLDQRIRKGKAVDA